MKLGIRPDRSGVAPETGERGAVMAEFAIVFPLLAVLLVGIIEFGSAFTKAQAVEAAAREGARVASLSTTTAGAVTARVNAALNGIVAGPTTTVSPNLAQPCLNRQGLTVTVTVTASDEIDIPFLAPIPVNFEGSAVFRCEA